MKKICFINQENEILTRKIAEQMNCKGKARRPGRDLNIESDQLNAKSL